MITDDQANVKSNYIKLIEMKSSWNQSLRVSLTDGDGESNLEARYEITLQQAIQRQRKKKI